MTPYNPNHETSLLPKSWQSRPEPTSDKEWAKSEEAMRNSKVMNFFMPDRLFNAINKYFS